MSLEEILGKIQAEIVKKDEIRQEMQANMRKVTRLSKQAIFLVHKANLVEAEDMLREAEGVLAKLSDLLKSYPDLFYMGSVDSAFQEYAEGHVFLRLVKDGHFVGFEEINVPMTSYVLGLADVIGELRRRALDSIRKDKAKTAEECLELMETVYAELTNHDELMILIPGLRRKCDVARRVIEATRGDVTIELRRSSLESSIKELKETLETERK